MRDVDRSHMPRRALLLLMATAGCPDDPGDPPPPLDLEWVMASLFERHGAATVHRHVQLGWAGDTERAWGLDGECRPDAALPAGMLVPVGDGRWRATALGDVRIPCGERDGIELHVRAADRLRISVPETVRVGDTFSAFVSAYDSAGTQLQRNDDAAAWSFSGDVRRGHRVGCMDVRPNHGDIVLVHAADVGGGRIRVVLDGVEATVLVDVRP